MKTRRDTGLRNTLRRIWGKLPRVLTSFVVAAAMVTPSMAPPVEAAGQTRTLKLYFIHTQEKAQITYKRNGRYDAKGLQQVNRMLRDWRRNEPTNMDPRLLDLVWEVYQKSGSRDYIHVVSGYRSPATNGMLRSRTKGVAKKSQHMLGKAMDFYLPDVKLKTLREIGMKFQVGGVGYYPTSGSPFVHMDVGGVRAWPRMSRSELVRLFPDGKTMHLPSDGSPLPGYEQAVADYKRRVGSSAIQVAGGGTTGPGDKEGKRPGKTLLAMLFGGGDEDEDATAIASGGGGEESEAPVTARAAKPPAAAQNPALAGVEGAEEAPVRETAVAAVEETVKAPVPLVRPAFQDLPADGGVQTALVAPPKNAAQDALAAAAPQTPAQEEFADLASYKVPVPQARVTEMQAGAALADAAEAAEEGEALAFVPVPALRPAGADALAAVAAAEVPEASGATEAGAKVAAAPVALAMAGAGVQPAEAKAAPVFASRPAESGVITATTPQKTAPTEMAALSPAQTRALATARPPAEPSAEARAKVALAAPKTEPVEMAAYAPDPMNGKRDIFRSAFDMPPEAPKAGRPKKQQAEAAQRVSKRTEPKLTQKIIAEWALTTGRMAQLSRPVRAPRFVSPALRASPTTVYSAGFSSAPAKVDSARFSGTAVNFMEVKRFSN